MSKVVGLQERLVGAGHQVNRMFIEQGSDQQLRGLGGHQYSLTTLQSLT